MYLGILDIFAGSDVFRYCQAKNDIQKNFQKFPLSIMACYHFYFSFIFSKCFLSRNFKLSKE